MLCLREMFVSCKQWKRLLAAIYSCCYACRTFYFHTYFSVLYNLDFSAKIFQLRASSIFPTIHKNVSVSFLMVKRSYKSETMNGMCGTTLVMLENLLIKLDLAVFDFSCFCFPSIAPKTLPNDNFSFLFGTNWMVRRLLAYIHNICLTPFDDHRE